MGSARNTVRSDPLRAAHARAAGCWSGEPAGRLGAAHARPPPPPPDSASRRPGQLGKAGPQEPETGVDGAARLSPLMVGHPSGPERRAGLGWEVVESGGLENILDGRE